MAAQPVSWPSAWRLAVGTLTVIPVRSPQSVDRATAGRAMILAPLAALPLAVTAAAAGWLAGLTAWPGPIPGLAVVAALALGTRGLHLDGLADTIDGLGSGRDRTGALEIMRRGDVGPFGVVALVLLLAAQVSAASTLTGSWPDAVLLAAVIAGSRAALPLACRRGVPAARKSGLGAVVAGSVAAPLAALVGLGAALVILGLGIAAGHPWWLAALAVSAAALTAGAAVRVAVRRLGGITGDVLGATVELTSTVLLLILAAAG